MATGIDIWALGQANDNYTIQNDYDVNGNLIYTGQAIPGTATSSTGWRIKKLTYDASNQLTSVTFPSASPAFAFIWDNRASLAFS